MEDASIKSLLTPDLLDITEAVEFVKSEKAGAVILFAGTTRDNFEGKSVDILRYEAHTKLALKTLCNISKQAKSKFRNEKNDELIHKVYIAHRLGEVPVKEESVLISLSATHRQEGWRAAMWILEKVKERAEIWKLENYSDGSGSWKANENSKVKTSF